MILGSVPESWPVLVLRVAHDGLFAIPKVKVRPDGLVTHGFQVYERPAMAADCGTPPIVSTAACALAAAPHRRALAKARTRSWRSGMRVKNDARTIGPPLT